MWPFKKKPPVEIHTDCIFESIMKALDVSNVEDWTLKSQLHGDEFKNHKLRYTLYSSVNEASLVDIYSRIFTDCQKQKMYEKCIELRKAIQVRDNQRTLQIESFQLKRWFPECFK